MVIVEPFRQRIRRRRRCTHRQNRRWRYHRRRLLRACASTAYARPRGAETAHLGDPADDDRPAVGHVVESVVAFAESKNWRTAPAGRWWVPADDPHRRILGP